jgi:hypothetical protein
VIVRRYSIQTVFMSVNSRMPCTPSSRPWPDHFTPPKGKRGSEATENGIHVANGKAQ